MRCKLCDAEMFVKPYEGVPIWVCSKEGCVWIENAALEQIVKRKEKTFEPEAIDQVRFRLKERASIPPEEFRRTVRCSVCDTPTRPIKYQVTSFIIVNICPKGHGVFLDPGELEKIQIFRELWDEEVRHNRLLYEGMAAKGSVSSGRMPDPDRTPSFLDMLLDRVLRNNF